MPQPVDAILEDATNIHLATFTFDAAIRIRQRFIKASNASTTAKAKLYEYAAAVDQAIRTATEAGSGCVTIKGTRGFLRLVASQAGQEELLRVEREMQV